MPTNNQSRAWVGIYRATPSSTPISDCIRSNWKVRQKVEFALFEDAQRDAHRASEQPSILLRDTGKLPPFDDNDLDNPHLLATAAAEIYRMRRARDRLMPEGLMGEPGWDILLALYSEDSNGITVSSLCYGSAVPQSTALRWIGVLEAQGLVSRAEHHRDDRIALVSLTEQGRFIVERCLKAMLRSARE